MCNLGAEQTSSWLMVDAWEAFQSYQRTAVVLDHFDHEINTVGGGVVTQEGERRHAKVMLLAGSDLIATMSEPGVWSDVDVRRCGRACAWLLMCLVVGPHLGAIRMFYRRTSRGGHGSGDGQPGEMATQHPPHPSADPERRVVDQGAAVLAAGDVCEVSAACCGGGVHRRERVVCG